MRYIFLAVLIAALPASVMAADPGGPLNFDKLAPQSSAAPVDRLVPLKGSRSGNLCASYGQGFVRVEGTEMCVKLGGVINVDAGKSSGVR